MTIRFSLQSPSQATQEHLSQHRSALNLAIGALQARAICMVETGGLGDKRKNRWFLQGMVFLETFGVLLSSIVLIFPKASGYSIKAWLPKHLRTPGSRTMKNTPGSSRTMLFFCCFWVVFSLHYGQGQALSKLAKDRQVAVSSKKKHESNTSNGSS